MFPPVKYNGAHPCLESPVSKLFQWVVPSPTCMLWQKPSQCHSKAPRESTLCLALNAKGASVGCNHLATTSAPLVSWTHENVTHAHTARQCPGAPRYNKGRVVPRVERNAPDKEIVPSERIVVLLAAGEEEENGPQGEAFEQAPGGKPSAEGELIYHKTASRP